MTNDLRRRARDRISGAAKAGLDWVDFAAEATDALRGAVDFDRCCWHTVDPGTMLFTGSVNRDISCSGTWLAEHEYVTEDVNKWWFLARSGRLAGATSLATHGDLSRSARHRSQEGYGVGDELRASFLADGTYWGAAGLLRDSDRPWFTEDDVSFLADICELVAHGLRRALISAPLEEDAVAAVAGPGIVVFDAEGRVTMTSPAADHLVRQFVEDPSPTQAAASAVVQSVAARTRALGAAYDPIGRAARARVRTRSGAWLVLYGTPLAGEASGNIAVIIQPAPRVEVAPIIALAYGLTERERQLVHATMEGKSTKDTAKLLHISPYTVQDHFKSIFDKTGVRTRSELIGRIFLEHYCPRWEELDDRSADWTIALASPGSL